MPILHLFRIARAAMSSMHLSPQMMLKRVQEKAPPHMRGLLAQDANGNTLLHHAGMNKISDAAFASYMQRIGNEAAAAMAKTINNEGKLPLQIAAKTFGATSDAIVPYSLFELTKKYDPQDEVFNRNDVFLQYANKPLSAKAREHLRIACDVVEKIEACKIDSVTNPSVNDMPEEEYMEKRDRTMAMRVVVTNNNVEIANKMDSFVSPQMLLERQFAHLENEALHVLHYRTGNCFEFAMVGLYILINEYKKACAEMYRIENGDHAFIVFGRDKNGHPSKTETFGDDAVVCDAHSKRVFLAKEIPEKMMSWTFGVMPPGTTKKMVGWTRASYNPAFHSLQMPFSLTVNQLHVVKRPGH